MALNFDWPYFWSYYQRISYAAVQEKMKAEVLADNWLFDQTADVQIKVLKDAPREFIEEVKGNLKPDAIKALSPELIDWSKL